MLSDLEKARRMARVLVSDIALYAGDEVRIGLEKDDLFDRLGPAIEQARVYFEHNVDAGVGDRQRIFAHALVDGLIYRYRGVQTQIW